MLQQCRRLPVFKDPTFTLSSNLVLPRHRRALLAPAALPNIGLRHESSWGLSPTALLLQLRRRRSAVGDRGYVPPGAV